jgi:hypothetical protein
MRESDFENQEDFYRAIVERMDTRQFWPNVWSVSDRGDWDLITRDVMDAGRGRE